MQEEIVIYARIAVRYRLLLATRKAFMEDHVMSHQNQFPSVGDNKSRAFQETQAAFAAYLVHKASKFGS